jgi:hypothetical protein
MTSNRRDAYTNSALALFAACALMAGIVAATNRGDLTSATLILGSVATFVAGIFILTFTREEGLNRQFVSLLSVQGTLDIARLCADLGIKGNAHIVPVHGEGKEPSLLQVIPVTEYREPGPSDGLVYLTGAGGKGVAITPLGYPLLRRLETSFALRLPDNEEGILSSVREVYEEVLEVADRVTLSQSGDSILIEIFGYRLLPGCHEIWKESPKACTLCPCPICSLAACMLAKGTGRACTLEQVAAGPEAGTLRLVLTLLPLPDM